MDMNRFEERIERRREFWEWRRRHRSPLAGLFVGGCIVAVGVLLLLDNLGIVRFRELWDFWPLILVVFGVGKILDGHTPAAYVMGGLLALLGSLLLLDNLGILRFEFSLFWPVLIIALGLCMLLRVLNRKSYVEGAKGTSGSSDATLSPFCIFSGAKRKIDSQDFKGGDVVAIFGGVHLDLRHAAIAGEQAVIDVNSLFGGIEIRVPETWLVTMKGVGIFGAFDDKTLHPKPDPNVKSPQLVITGTAVFSGIKAEN